MKEYIFDTLIISHEKVNSGYIEFPFDVMKEFGKKRPGKSHGIF